MQKAETILMLMVGMLLLTAQISLAGSPT